MKATQQEVMAAAAAARARSRLNKDKLAQVWLSILLEYAARRFPFLCHAL